MTAPELSDRDRAQIASIWIGVANARSMQTAAEQTYLAGLLAGRERQREIDARICAHEGKIMSDQTSPYVAACRNLASFIRANRIEGRVDEGKA